MSRKSSQLLSLSRLDSQFDACDRGHQDRCTGYPCNRNSASVALVNWSGCTGHNTELFDVSSWTPQQLDQLQVSIKAIDSSIDDAALLSAIPDTSLRRFHFLHQLIGQDRIKIFYPGDTIRQYRRRLRLLGYDYPPRPSVPGPGRPRRSSSSDSVVASAPPGGCVPLCGTIPPGLGGVCDTPPLSHF